MHTTRTAATAALLFAAAVTALPAAADDPFGPIHVAVNRHQYTGRGCPIEIVFTGSINLRPHPRGLAFQYHWERSDGAKGPVHVVRPGPNERTLVVREKWRVGGRGNAYDVSETLHVGSGNTRVSESSPTVHVECR
ncbi:MAG TPA: hypothetical protein VII36_07585 [Usitatibacter sp.]